MSEKIIRYEIKLLEKIIEFSYAAKDKAARSFLIHVIAHSVTGFPLSVSVKAEIWKV